MLLTNIDFRITSPTFTFNDKLITVETGSTIVVYTKEYKPSKILTLPTSIPSSVIISTIHYTKDTDGLGKLYVGTSGGHLLVWNEENVLTLLHTFPQELNITSIFHSKDTLAIGFSCRSKGVVKFYRLNNNLISFESEKSFALLAPVKEIQLLSTSFVILSENHTLHFYSTNHNDNLKPLMLDKLPKYNSKVTRTLAVFPSTLIVGFSSGIIGIYLIKERTAKLLTTLHWHYSPISALAWDKSTKSLFSGAAEGVLCYWNSPLSPFLRSTGHEKEGVISKYERTTRPSMTLPGFGASFLFISLATTGNLAVVTSDNSLRVLVPVTSRSLSDQSASTLLLMHKNGPIPNDPKIDPLPITISELFSNIFIIPNIEGAQALKNSKYSNLLGVMPSGVPRIPGSFSTFTYCSSLILSDKEIIVAMKSHDLSCVQLALWAHSEDAGGIWNFLSSASEGYSEKIFFSGPLINDKDAFLVITSTGQVSLWRRIESKIQKQYILRKADTDGNSVVACSFSYGHLILVFKNSWCLIYKLSSVPFDADDDTDVFTFKLELSISALLLKSNYEFAFFISPLSFVIGSQRESTLSLYSINSNTSVEMLWTYRLAQKSSTANMLISASEKRGLIVGIPGGPLLEWKYPISSPKPSKIIMNALPTDAANITYIDDDKYAIQRHSGQLLVHPPTSETSLNLYEDQEEKAPRSVIVKQSYSTARKLMLLAGKGPAVLIDSIVERPSHTLPSPDYLMKHAIEAIWLR